MELTQLNSVLKRLNVGTNYISTLLTTSTGELKLWPSYFSGGDVERKGDCEEGEQVETGHYKESGKMACSIHHARGRTN